MEKETFELLERYREHLSEQEYRTIKGQIRAGDTDGAVRGLHRLLHRRGVEF